MSKVIPYLTVSDSRAALDFYQTVFGATVVDGELYEMEDGRIGHLSMKIGDAHLYISDEFPEMGVLSPTTRGGATSAVVIHVDDTDATYATALANGANAERPPANQMGFRSAWFHDPWGHRWSPTSAEKPELD